nr:MAG TPA: hypothetical protein [Caudoviricetes sp.]
MVSLYAFLYILSRVYTIFFIYYFLNIYGRLYIAR